MKLGQKKSERRGCDMENDATWVFIVENPNAIDPLEVIYRLALVDKDHNIIEQDGYFTYCNHGIFDRLKSALQNEVLIKREIEPRFKLEKL